MCVCGYPGWRASSSGGNGRQAIQVVLRPIGPTASPSEFATFADAKHARGSMPHRADIRFHVAVMNV